MTKTVTYQRELPVESIEPAGGSGIIHQRRTDALVHHNGLGRSLRFALDGFLFVLQTQRNFRIQLTAAIGAGIAGAYFHITTSEWMAIVIVSALVLVLEMVNTAFEASIDLVTRDYHPLAKNAKDIAAAAVLLASFCALCIAGIVFGPHVVALLGHVKH